MINNKVKISLLDSEKEIRTLVLQNPRLFGQCWEQEVTNGLGYALAKDSFSGEVKTNEDLIRYLGHMNLLVNERDDGLEKSVKLNLMQTICIMEKYLMKEIKTTAFLVDVVQMLDKEIIELNGMARYSHECQHRAKIIETKLRNLWYSKKNPLDLKQS